MSRKVYWVLTALVVVALALSACAGAPAEEEGEFVFGIVLVGPKNDRGWSQAHYEGGLYVEENLSNARMIVFESLNPADKPEATLEGVVDDMVSDGAQLIITTSDEFEEDTVGAAEKYPDVVFISISGDDAWAEGQDVTLGVGRIGEEIWFYSSELNYLVKVMSLDTMGPYDMPVLFITAASEKGIIATVKDLYILYH